MNPAIFALICALISAVLSGLISLVLSPFFAAPGETGEAFAGGLVGLVLTVILSPIYTALTLLIGAGLYHLLVLLFVRPGNAGFEATFRVVCYVAAIQLVSWIPIVNLVAGIYAIVLSIFGIREAHGTTMGKAVAIVLIPVAVILFFVLILVALLGAALFFGTQQQQF
ncbi:MAG: YIP1 family protein [Actinomycetota bacterium]|nr:YIP1 family protein [Actinomycetota bacterium]